MTRTAVVIGMAVMATIAAGWREHRRSHDLRRFQQWSRLGGPNSGRTGNAPSWNRVVLVAISVCCCGVAAMVPGISPTAVGDRDAGPNLVIALDTSKSMYASDIRPSRIHEAVRQLHGVLRAAPVARVAIVGFAGSSAILCPLTDDRDAASEYLDQLERVPVGGRGSDIGLGLRRAADAFGAAGGERLVLLVSDGEGTGSELEAAVIRIKGERVRVWTIGVGTLEGAPVPVQPRSTQFQRDPVEPWQPARTILTETTLADIARQTGGTYQRLHVDSDLSSAIAPAWSLPTDDPAGGAVPFSVSRVLLLIALLVLGADTALGVARGRASRVA
jgi:Ca-activated chloride channel family protein